ncbi:putative aspartate aminotransferase [Amylocarpus encephaloides]|uniref:Aspartate aminotransferase n=1 Tax=Amylocarpus encephaloides TaxID=45428 RepID=A0A9P7YQB7_9HELO|nr:putative aspartate aminotransferase [Amylocarpus encephaloides]
MVKIEPFEVEQWMDLYETTPGVLNIAETCAASISVDDLVALCEDSNIPAPLDLSKKLTYGSIRGSDSLRDRLAALYSARSPSPLSKDNVLITQGAINANFLLLYTLVGPGDHVVCTHPTYQQLYSVPESLGAEVSLWKLRKEKKYVPDLDDLKTLVKENTKMIIINNPNNPTGATTPKSVLQALVEFANEKDIIILSDEVYRPLFHSVSPMDAEFPPSILNLGYSKTISTGSMSKAYSLAGIRCGWIASRDTSIIEAIATARDYTTISVSQLDDQVASYALSNSVMHALLGRNMKLAKTNVAILEDFIGENSGICSWVKPTGGTTALVKFENRSSGAVDDVQFCKDVLENTKVMFIPASKCFGSEFKGYVRIGFVCETPVLKEALQALGMYIRKTLT